MARRVPEQLEVYEPGRSYKDAPNDVVSYEEGIRRVKAGEASFCKHNRAIRMHRPRLSLRGLSSKPDDKLTLRYIAAKGSGLDLSAITAIEAWGRAQ